MGWKDLSYGKKGFIIGLLIGILWSIPGLLGIYHCNWNPVAGGAVSGGILCTNWLIHRMFYLPALPGNLLYLLTFFEQGGTINYGILIPMVMVFAILPFSFFGLLVGRMAENLKSKNK